jgi:hypothetical protein
VGPVTIESCWSTGEIQGGAAGGIVGHWCANVTVTNCYSEGNITAPYDAGGIVADSAGQGSSGCIVSNCYSLGTINEPNGGIVGAVNSPGSVTCSITITNCFSLGALSGSISNAGAILASVNAAAAGNWSVTVTHCYAAGNSSGTSGSIVGAQGNENGTDVQIKGTTVWSANYPEKKHGSSGWNDTNAASVLTGAPSATPGLGATWFSLGTKPGLLDKINGIQSLFNNNHFRLDVGENSRIHCDSRNFNKRWPSDWIRICYPTDFRWFRWFL